MGIALITKDYENTIGAEDAGNCGVLRIMVSKVRNDVSCCGKDCQPVSGKMDFL